MILGLGGLTNGWRTVGRIWQAPALIGDILAVVTALVWATLLVLYVGKWFWARNDAIAEARHPVQGILPGLLPVSSMIVSIVLAPMLPSVAWGICVAAVVGQVAFSAYGMGGIWQGKSSAGSDDAGALHADGGRRFRQRHSVIDLRPSGLGHPVFRRRLHLVDRA